MFDIGWTEITIILIATIILIGPKDLPKVLHTVGKWIAKAKSMTREFRGHVDDMVKESELDEVKSQVESLGSFDANTAIENTIDSDGDIKSAFDFSGDEFSNPIDLDDSSYNEDVSGDPPLPVEEESQQKTDLDETGRENAPDTKQVADEKIRRENKT